MKKIAVIHHDADFDGKLSNEVCRHHLARLYPESSVHSYGLDYGRPVPSPSWEIETSHTHNGGLTTRLAEWSDYDSIYIVDLSVDELMAKLELRDKIVWIDHHKSAIEKWDHIGGFTKMVGYRIDGVAACRLCWQWFTFERGPHGDPRTHPSDAYLPSKQDFIDRKVSEPTLIRLAGEYDVWDHRDSDSNALQFGLRTLDDVGLHTAAEEQFNNTSVASALLRSYIETGRSIESYMEKDAAFRMKVAHTVRIWNLCLLVLNGRGNSLTFKSGLLPQHDACMMWFFDGNKVKVSLYHAPGKEDIDLSFHAKRLGGGGHKGACGFIVDTLTSFERMLDQE